MRFIHIADLHFDSPFTSLDNIGNFGDLRRLEQRNVFKKIIEYIKRNNIDCLFIVGDLYEHQYVKKSTIEYINNLFETIPDTEIFITPGNHDPFIKNSFYETFTWNKNVHISKSEIETFSFPDVDIYMTTFNDFYQNNSPISKITLKNNNKINILITHCDLNGSQDENGYSYNPISETKLNGLNFDYVAMGHIHKTNFEKDKKIIYPGSVISFGFDELGEHGMVVGEIEKNELETEFVKLDDREFEKYEFSVNNIKSQEELIEKISNINLDDKNMYELILIGDKEFDINTRKILDLIEIKNILKIKDCTKISYDIEQISKENNLRGIFVRELIKEYQTGIYTEEQIKKAIEIGLDVM